MPTVTGETAFTATAVRSGTTITLDVDGRAEGWSLLLRGANGVTSVQGGQADAGAEGVRITPAAGAARVVVQL